MWQNIASKSNDRKALTTITKNFISPKFQIKLIFDMFIFSSLRVIGLPLFKKGRCRLYKIAKTRSLPQQAI